MSQEEITRNVSDEIYRAVELSGLLGGFRKKVYDFIWANGPVTISQTLQEIEIGTAQSGTISTRFSELRRMDAIEIVAVVKDPIGGRHHITLYDVTGRVPKPLPKPNPRTFFGVSALSSGDAGYIFRFKANADKKLIELQQRYDDAELIVLKEQLKRARG
jgi:hypothetical protein